MYNLSTTGDVETNILLTSDLIIRRAISKCYSNTDIKTLIIRWQSYLNIVTWYLWQEYS